MIINNLAKNNPPPSINGIDEIQKTHTRKNQLIAKLHGLGIYNDDEFSSSIKREEDLKNVKIQRLYKKLIQSIDKRYNRETVLIEKLGKLGTFSGTQAKEWSRYITDKALTEMTRAAKNLEKII